MDSENFCLRVKEHGFRVVTHDKHYVVVANLKTTVRAEGFGKQQAAHEVVLLGLQCLEETQTLISRGATNRVLIEVQGVASDMRFWDEVDPSSRIRRWYTKAHYDRQDGTGCHIEIGGVASKALLLHTITKMVRLAKTLNP